jgi:hypothetical protein
VPRGCLVPASFLGPLAMATGGEVDGGEREVTAAGCDQPILSRLAVSTSTAGDGVPLSICRLAVQALGLTGAGLSVITAAGHRGSVCATDDVAAAIEQMQFNLGEGPCVDAFHHGPVLIGDLEDPEQVAASRWPQFTREAAAAGARALFALPLEIGAIRVGALDLYCDQPRLLTDPELSVALTFADAAAGALLADQFADTEMPFDIDASGSTVYAEVHQATGMISVQLDVSLDDAFVRLRAYAFATARPVHEVARDVVAGRLRFDDQDGDYR